MLKKAAGAVLLAAAIATSACWSSGDQATDAQVRSEIATSLDAANIRGVQVSVVDGQVVLTGTVPDQATSDRVAEIAKGAKGAKGVTNQLIVQGGGGTVAGPTNANENPVTPDQVLAARVNQRLIASPDLAGSRIVPAAAGGVVTLTGTVPSDAAKAAAEKAARSVAGVTTVTNQLEVVASTPVVTVPDDQLEDKVKEVLDTQFPDFTLFPRVTGGNVSLSGAVPNRGVILQVSNAIHAIPGVKAVDTSHLTVQGGEEGAPIGAPSTKKP